MSLTLSGRNVADGTAVTVHCADGLITAIEPATPNDDLPWLGPGLVDLQVNGYGGLDFNQPPLATDLVARLTTLLWQEGVTTYLPTIITNTDAAITASVQAVAAARQTDPLLAATIPGIHLEGPFISPEDGARGAHPKAAVTAPDWEQFCRWQEAAEGLIRLVTLSPEWPNANDFIARCVAAGIVVAIGHTAATAAQIDAAVAAGATLSTHFGNGSHPLLPRHDNYLWAQLANDDLTLSLIGDGWHLPDTILRVALRVKGERAFLVSDAVALAGLPPGTYETPIGGQVTVTPAGRLHLVSDPRLLAGSICPLRLAISGMVQRQVVLAAIAWAMASTRPATLLQLPVAAGLVVGAPADLVQWTWEAGQVTIQQTCKAGQFVSASMPATKG